MQTLTTCVDCGLGGLSGALLGSDARVRAAETSSATRRRQVRVASVVVVVAGFLFGLATNAYAASCQNTQFRVGPSNSLPDCRAYEMVSPSDKNGSDAGFITSFGGTLTFPSAATSSGSAVAYGAGGAFAGASGDVLPDSYVAVRGSDSWVTSSVNPPVAASSTFFCVCGAFGFSADLTKQLSVTTAALTPGAAAGQSNFYLHDSKTGSNQLIETQPPGFGASFILDGAAEDLTHMVSSSGNTLGSTPAPPSGAFDTYDWTGGQLKLAGVLPDGTVDARGAQAGEGVDPLYFDPASADGTRIYWTEPGNNGTGAIYLRQDDATTTAITVSQRGANPSVSPQPGYFWAASADGSEAYFTSPVQLTSDTSTNYGTDLYQYDVASGHLTDISVDGNVSDPSGAEVTGVVGVGSSASGGTYVYFVAGGVLTIVPNARGQRPTAGDNNLYVWHDDGSSDTTRFIGTLNGGDSVGGPSGNESGTGDVEDVSPDGTHLAFLSSEPLTGFDNTDANTGSADREAFLYDAQTDTLSCPSCDRSGRAPTGSASFHQAYGGFTANFYAPMVHNVLDDGRLFFESPDQLLPQDTNQATDVYQFEEQGVGDCQRAAACLHLISTGRSGEGSYFADASASGNDIFFTTDQQLVGQDVDDNFDLYDARVDGGFPAPATQVPCSGDACKGSPSSPPAPPTAASVSFFGPGNLSPTAARLKVKTLSKVVHGTTFFVRVHVPTKGRITIAGARIKKVTQSFRRSGTYRVRVRLTLEAKRALKKKHKLKFKLRVRYTPSGGASSSATVPVMVER